MSNASIPDSLPAAESVAVEYTVDQDIVIQAERAYLEERRRTVNGDSPDDADEHHGTPPLTMPEVRDDNLWGIALSGGGIRSATFALGVIQGLTKRTAIFSKGIFRRFDYLSTVSGGGYIGGALSSLLTSVEDRRHDGERPPAAPPPPGVDADNSPFTGLRERDFYQQLNDSIRKGKTRLENSVRHQIHHLRANGNYLGAGGSPLNWKMERVIGAVGGGVAYSVIVFTLVYLCAVAVLHVLLIPISPFEGQSAAVAADTSSHVSSWSRLGFSRTPSITFTPSRWTFEVAYKARGGGDGSWARRRDSLRALGITAPRSGWSPSQRPRDTSATARADGMVRRDISAYDAAVAWYRWGVRRPLERMLDVSTGGMDQTRWLWFSLLFGALYATGAFLFSQHRARTYIALIRRAPKDDTPAGLTEYSRQHNAYITDFNMLSVALALLVMFLIAVFAGNSSSTWPLLVPAAMATGSALVLYTLTIISDAVTPDSYRVVRSVRASLKGASLMGLLAAVLIPIALVLLLSMSRVSLGAWIALLLFLCGGVIFGKGKGVFGVKLPTGFFAKHYRPALNTVVFLLLAFLMAPASRLLLGGYDWLATNGVPSEWQPFIAAGVCGALALGVSLFSANRLSLHSFYRDRLIESYLQTDAMLQRRDVTAAQGMPAMNVRNHELLQLSDLGEGNMRGPYHLITAALNLRGSQELVRRALKSDHFLFSKYYIGSQTTGWVASKTYEDGFSSLAAAVAMSGAAASSGMGIYSFFAQAFFTTVFNLRLGQWIPNPWSYCKSRMKPEKLRWDDRMQQLRLRHSWLPYVWLPYLLRELWGVLNAKSNLVNVTDGGHTGDNLGLLPLFRRRCRVIVAVDADHDPHYEFDSFNNAVRLALIEENIRVEIDLDDLHARDRGDGVSKSVRSAAVGIIRYPETDAHPRMDGVLVIIKSSVSEWDPTGIDRSPDAFDDDAPTADWLEIIASVAEQDRAADDGEAETPEARMQHAKRVLTRRLATESPLLSWRVPAHVENYNRSASEFPHQSTGDQFFDIQQFEAYRALGEHIAGQAGKLLAGVELLHGTKRMVQ
ncbi:MAG: hypothetical protein IPP94_10335 [Ignavibacteria bacterium]|nr:hypothetical protein [Ignavibacteria bacterium]